VTAPVRTELEPLPLIALELCFWALIALAESFAIVFVMERQGTR
jgi:hypothetical protein